MNRICSLNGITMMGNPHGMTSHIDTGSSPVFVSDLNIIYVKCFLVLAQLTAAAPLHYFFSTIHPVSLIRYTGWKPPQFLAIATIRT